MTHAGYLHTSTYSSTHRGLVDRRQDVYADDGVLYVYTGRGRHRRLTDAEVARVEVA